MEGKFPEMKIGQMFKIICYAGADISTTTSYFHQIYENSREPLDPSRDGMNFLATYIGYKSEEKTPSGEENSILQFQILTQNSFFGCRFSSEIGDGTPREEITSRPDLHVPKRLIRRIQRLDVIENSGNLDLESRAQ